MGGAAVTKTFPSRNILLALIATLLLTLNPGCAGSEGNLKVICAARAERPPIIDGNLEEPCWRKAEVRDDFTDPALGRPVPRRTAIRFLYDDANLYMGIECNWDDVEVLKRGIAQIRNEHGPSMKKIVPSIEGFSNRYGVEVFLDPGASQANYYQILFNAAGQLTGNYKAMWDAFHLKPDFEGKVAEKGWSVEFVLPIEGIKRVTLKPGNEWGLNVVRNDEGPYSIWKVVGSSFHEPKAFGRLLIGDYAEWWNAVWAKGSLKRLKAIGEGLQSYSKEEPFVNELFRLVSEKARDLDGLSKRHPPTNRRNFEALYRDYSDFRGVFERLETLCQTIEAISPAG